MSEKRTVEAAGGIVYRIVRSIGSMMAPLSANDVEVCLVHRPKYDDWSWPKGKLEINESHRHAAVREIGEETGFPVALGPFLGEVEYPLSSEGKKTRHAAHSDGKDATKHVLYWMATQISDDENWHRREAFGPIHAVDLGEVSEIAWLSLDKARKKLTHSTDRDMLALFVDRIEEGSLKATPLLLVRHAKAESRKQWDGTEPHRPITPEGAAAAYALDRELACYNPVELATSPWTRCEQTIEMLSWQTKRERRALPPLTEEAFEHDPQAAWSCFAEQIKHVLETGNTMAVCMHRPVIGGMFEHLRPLCASKSLAKRLVAKSPYMATANAFALFFVQTENGPRIIDIQKVTPIVY